MPYDRDTYNEFERLISESLASIRAEQLTPSGLELACFDLFAVAEEFSAEEYEGQFFEPIEAFDVWLERLGGKKNIRPYVDTLIAGRARAERILSRVLARGFDNSEIDNENHVRVRCSQCEALVINGTACHETRCPNSRQERDEE